MSRRRGTGTTRSSAKASARSLTFGAYLTQQWLPGKANTLAKSTWHGYRRKIERHVLPTLGAVLICRLKVTHLEGLYDSKLRPAEADTKALAPKTVLEIHLIIRGALNHAEKRGIVKRNVALVAHAPRLRSIPKHEAQASTAQQLTAFLRAAVGHRLFPAFWLAANSGMRRSELLGLKWSDIDLDPPAIQVLEAWRQWTQLEQTVTGQPNDHVFTPGNGQPVHPHSVSQTFKRISRNAGLPVIRFHDLRHTHATLLRLQAGVQPKVISERLGHESPAFTLKQYAHVIPGMQADAARLIADLVNGDGPHDTKPPVDVNEPDQKPEQPSSDDQLEGAERNS